MFIHILNPLHTHTITHTHTHTHTHQGEACSPSVDYNQGGIFVEFTSDYGNIPLFISSDPAVEVYEFQKGIPFEVSLKFFDTNSTHTYTPHTTHIYKYAHI